MQLLTEMERDHVAGTHQRIDRCIRLALGHPTHGIPCVFGLQQLNLRVMLLHVVTQHIAAHQHHPLTRHVVQRDRAVGVQWRYQHKGRGEIGSSETQLVFTRGAGGEGPHHVGFATRDQRCQILD